MASEAHRSALLKVLNEAHVPTDISVENLQHLVGQVLAANTITFSDEVFNPEGTKHNKALHIQVMCKEMVVAQVLIDNGSALNICPLITITKLGMSKADIQPSNMTIRAFDGSKR